MQIVYAFPPNIELIRRAFPLEGRTDVIFCYGDRIYNPHGVPVTPALDAHETVHSVRQGADPDGWWAQYIADRKFRFDEEARAHAAEYRVLCADARCRQERQLILASMVKKLGAPLYGGASRDLAKKLLRRAA